LCLNANGIQVAVTDCGTLNTGGTLPAACVAFSRATGDFRVGAFDAGAGDVSITATTGAIEGTGGLITAGRLTLVATGIGQATPILTGVDSALLTTAGCARLAI